MAWFLSIIRRCSQFKCYMLEFFTLLYMRNPSPSQINLNPSDVVKGRKFLTLEKIVIISKSSRTAIPISHNHLRFVIIASSVSAGPKTLLFRCVACPVLYCTYLCICHMPFFFCVLQIINTILIGWLGQEYIAHQEKLTTAFDGSYCSSVWTL